MEWNTTNTYKPLICNDIKNSLSPWEDTVEPTHYSEN